MDTTTYGEPDTAYYCAIDTYNVFYRPIPGTDVNLAYDPFGNLHVVFTAKIYRVIDYENACSVNINCGSVILHWDEASAEVTKICPPRFNNAGLLPGVEEDESDMTCIHPSIGFDEDGNAYVCWLQAFPRYYAFKDSLWTFIETHPETLWSSSDDWVEYEALFDSVMGEGLDISCYGVANYDIFTSRSFDGGATWMLPLNLSNTYSPNCDTGECLCEAEISVAKRVDDHLHIFAVLDKAAGNSIYGVGEVVQNPVLHIAIPIYLSVEENKTDLPTKPVLLDAYPNPFNSATQIFWEMPKTNNAAIEIVDIAGRRVKRLFSGIANAGYNAVIWDGTDDGGTMLSSGVYFCKLFIGNSAITHKLFLTK